MLAEPHEVRNVIVEGVRPDVGRARTVSASVGSERRTRGRQLLHQARHRAAVDEPSVHQDRARALFCSVVRDARSVPRCAQLNLSEVGDMRPSLAKSSLSGCVAQIRAGRRRRVVRRGEIRRLRIPLPLPRGPRSEEAIAVPSGSNTSRAGPSLPQSVMSLIDHRLSLIHI